MKSYYPKQESKHIVFLDANNLYGYAMSKFLPTSGSKWIDPKDFVLNKYSSNRSKRYVLEVYFEYPKELQELHNYYRLAPDKIKIKTEMMSDNQLKIADLYNIQIDNVKELVSNFFGKEKYVICYERLRYLKLGLKLKKMHLVLEFNQSQWLKQYVEFNTQKRIEAEENNDKDGKAFYKLMTNAVYGKTMENLTNKIDVKFMSNK